MQTHFTARRALTWQLLAVALALNASSAALASDDDASAPVLPSGDIVQKLSKDIVLDPGAPAVGRNRRVQRSGIDLRVHFAFGSAQLLTQGQRQLDQLAAALTHQSLSSDAFELAGHTDAVGTHAANMRLSLDRAKAAKAYLVQTHGLPPERLLTIGFGFTRLALPGNPTAGANRRVEVRRLRVAAGQGPAATAPHGTPAPGTLVLTPKPMVQ